NSDPNPADGRVEKNDRLHYLIKDRDWKLVNTTEARGNFFHFGADKTDADVHKGFEAALESATTGRLPDSDAATDPPHHSAANAAVMHETVKMFGDDPSLIKKGGAFASMRGTLGEMTADYMGDVQRTLYVEGDLPVN